MQPTFEGLVVGADFSVVVNSKHVVDETVVLKYYKLITSDKIMYFEIEYG